MYLSYRNVNDGFAGVVRGLADGTIPSARSGSRNGGVIRAARPVLFTFDKPTERVLFNAARDVNPFSVLYEAMWALAGRNDVASIAYYTKKMTEYSDDGQTWHGAYGHRWRHSAEGDQLDQAVALLREDPASRRVVLSMWDARADLIGQRKDGKDYPCNTHAYVTVRDGRLNLTVCNRSNDSVLGLFGTNYVLFSFLLEYLAARVGVQPGEYHHMSNDLHAYGWNWEPEAWLAAENERPGDDVYGFNAPYKFPLVRDPAAFEAELPLIVEQYSGREPMEEPFREYTEPFFKTVAQPMFDAWLSHKKRTNTAADHVARIAADDWRLACTAWLKRRADRRARAEAGKGGGA